MDAVRTAPGLLAVGLLAAAGAVTLVEAPSETYSGTTADAVSDSLLGAGLVVLAVHLLLTPPVRERLALRTAALGCLLLASGALATVAAGQEAWDGPFVVGFVLAALGWLAAALLARSATYAACLLGLVLALAFFGSGGCLALAAAVGLALRGRGSAEPAAAS